MSSWTMPASVSAAVAGLAALIDERNRPRFWMVFFGVLVCREKRRTASAWFRSGGIGVDFRRAYHVFGSVGRRVQSLGGVLLHAVEKAAGGRDPGVRPGRHGDQALRAVRRGCRRAPQPDAGAGRGGVGLARGGGRERTAADCGAVYLLACSSDRHWRSSLRPEI